MIVKKGDYSIVEDTLDDKTRELSDIPEYEEGAETGSTMTSNVKGEQIKSKPEKYKTSKLSKTAKKGPDWKSALSRVLSSSKLSDKAKKLLRNLTYQKPIVDWKLKLKKFFDKSLSGLRTVFPKRRFISKGLYLHGIKRKGTDELKIIVAAIDTSGSISHDQGKTFLIEVANLVKTFKADRFIIIYCSDDVHNPIIELKKGPGGRMQEPDLSLWPTTFGNTKGFLPPFEWLDKRKIIPSVMIYLTDTGGPMPTKNQFNISKYDKKVFWFVCAPTVYNPPTFGEVILIPIAGLKKTS